MHEIIQVTIINAETNAPFDTVNLHLDQLPDSFEAETTMSLAGEDDEFLVLEARPPTAAEFAATGKLTLLLKKIEKVKLDENQTILFGLPTINDEIPGIALDSTKLSKQTIELHEDDWRQIEFVSATHRDALETELAGIHAIHENFRVGIGFKKTHIRSLITSPLAAEKIPLAKLAETLGDRATSLDGVSYRGVAGLVRDSFAFRTLSAIELYGQTENGNLTSLCIQNKTPNNLGPADLDALAQLAAAHNLYLIDYVACKAIVPTLEAYREYFTAQKT